jgi:hypothetical protein
MLPLVHLVVGAQLLLAQTATVASGPSIRGSAPLPIAARSITEAIGLATPEPSTLLLRVVHLAYERPEAEARRTRESLERLLSVPAPAGDVVPLPLSPEVWRSTILPAPEGHGDLITAILRDRRAALLYVGLLSLDDETLTWVGSNRATLLHLRKFPQIFASFGRSIHVRNGRIVVPGGTDAEPLWMSIAGADASKPAAFIERVIAGDGRLAFLFDAIAHLDAAHQRFALGLHLGPATKEARLRALLTAFTAAAPEWRIGERLFPKPPIDGAILLSALAVLPDGNLTPPIARRLWDRVFRGDELNDVAFESVSGADVTAMAASLNIDASWLAERILRVPYAVGRRRLDAFLFGQRVFWAQPPSSLASVATALRGYLSFPALMISFARIGLTDPELFVCAAEHAVRLNTIELLALRKSSIAQFQSAVALIERAHRTGGLNDVRSSALIHSLCLLDVSSRSGYGPRFSTWLREVFLKALPARPSAEETMLAVVAGVGGAQRPLPIVSWEGRSYRVDPAATELARLQLVRQRQGSPTVDEALSGVAPGAEDNRENSNGEQALADALVSIVYAIHLGDPEGSAVTSGNVALRHDFGFVAPPARGAGDAWRLPLERFDGKAAWRIRGSVLGLEAALGRLSLRRLDPTAMPGEPRIGSQDRQTVMLTAALMNPFALSDEVRDRIAAALAAGRARVAALTQDPTKLDEITQAAGFSEWRRHALAWTLTERRDVAPLFSLLDLFWLGYRDGGDRRELNEWGAATLPLTGCLCLTMPDPNPWEDLRGHGSAVLATRGADISLRIAETLASLNLPAALAPALAGFVTQDVIDHAQLADPDDWQEFGWAVQDLPRERMFDYIAALTAVGPLVPVEGAK